jgi:aminoglycoside phosphotransferase (APT) family kinase protein
VEQIATFLNEMHSTPTNMLPGDLPVGERPWAWQQFYEDVRLELFPHMRDDARDDFERHFARFFRHVNRFDFDPVLRHGDLGPGNILFDPDNRELSGIIDFGSASLGDPAQDIGGLLTSYGQPFIDQILHRHICPTAGAGRTAGWRPRDVRGRHFGVPVRLRQIVDSLTEEVAVLLGLLKFSRDEVARNRLSQLVLLLSDLSSLLSLRTP